MVPWCRALGQVCRIRKTCMGNPCSCSQLTLSMERRDGCLGLRVCTTHHPVLEPGSLAETRQRGRGAARDDGRELTLKFRWLAGARARGRYVCVALFANANTEELKRPHFECSLSPHPYHASSSFPC